MKVKELIVRLLEEDMNAEVFVTTTDESRKGNTSTEKEAIELINQEPILDKIYADIQKLRGCSCWESDGIIDDVEDIIDKYKAESEG